MTVTAVWKITMRPLILRNWATALAWLPGFPSGSPSRSATWSEPMTTAPGCSRATACALAAASRRARPAGVSPASGVSSTSGGTTLNASLSRDSSSRR
jgi:hypothetical protein